MEVSDLTEKMFQLPYRFAVPDILYAMELEEEHPDLTDMGLEIKILSSETVKYAETIVPKYQKASLNDLLALALAKQEKCPLVTGDQALRKAGTAEAVVILGTIWIVEEMVRHKIIDISEASRAFEKMKENERRLPWDVVKIKLCEMQDNYELPHP